MSSNLALRGSVLGALAAMVALIVGEIAGSESGPWITFGLPLAAVVFGALAGYLAYRGPRDAVSAVTTVADRLAEGALEERVTISSRATRDLTRNFNSMAGRLQEAFAGMEAEHARLEAVFEASTDAMIAVSDDTRVRFLNAAALKVLGIRRDDALGRPFIESTRDYELDGLLRRGLSHAGHGETAFVTYGQQRTPLQATVVPIREGGDWAMLLLLTDLTEVQRLDQVRRDFLTNVSHELRTPLASIRALVETLESGAAEAPEERAEFHRRILEQVHRLTALVNELLDLSRIESGAMELRREAVDLAEAVREAWGLLRTRWEREGLSLDAPDPPGVVVEADRAAVLRVVSNLLDNAIKFSPAQGTVHVEMAEEGELGCLSVRDEGPGIARQDLGRVFERFYKVDTARAESGVGLGLAIVKHLVRAHGGTAEVTSPPGSGAVFTVRLPRASTASNVQPSS